MKIALAQIKTHRNYKENLNKIINFMQQAKLENSDLIVFPETSMALIPSNEGINFNDIGQDIQDHFVQEILKESKRLDLCVVFGFWEKGKEKVKNSVIFADAGNIVYKYSKTHLYNAFSYNESKDIDASNNVIEAFDTRFGKIGIMVCYELRFPEIARTLALQGAKLILVPTAWVDGKLKREHFSILTRARALENTVFLCASNQTQNIYTGESTLVSPLGVELIKMDSDEGLKITEINLEEITKVREVLPCLEQRRKELYKL